MIFFECSTFASDIQIVSGISKSKVLYKKFCKIWVCEYDYTTFWVDTRRIVVGYQLGIIIRKYFFPFQFCAGMTYDVIPARGVHYYDDFWWFMKIIQNPQNGNSTQPQHCFAPFGLIFPKSSGCHKWRLGWLFGAKKSWKQLSDNWKKSQSWSGMILISVSFVYKHSYAQLK